jgi:hypothetical protein
MIRCHADLSRTRHPFLPSPNRQAKMNVGRSRNAEAQAALRARRRAHIDGLERENDDLKKELERSRSRAISLETSNEILREELQTARQMLGFDIGPSSRHEHASNERRLSFLVQAQRKTIRELREAIERSRRELDVSPFFQCDLDSSTEEGRDDGKRPRLSPQSNSSPTRRDGSRDANATPAPPPSLTFSSTTSDHDLAPETPYIEQWIPTQAHVGNPPLDTGLEAQIGSYQPASRSENNTSVQALELMLAQPQDFKHKVVSALLRDLLKDNGSDVHSNIRKEHCIGPLNGHLWHSSTLPSASIFLTYLLHLLCGRTLRS